MKHFFVLYIAVSFVATTAIQAQTGPVNPQCTVGVTQNACQKTIDLFQYMAPQFGILVTGGNATLGQGGTVGGWGHVSLNVRGNVIDGSAPQVDPVGAPPGPAQSDRYSVNSQLFGLPQVDAAVGLFKGIPLGVTNAGGVDLLVSAEYLPAFNSGSLKVTVPNGSFKLGVGGRLGVLQESHVLPGVAVTYLYRSLPITDIAAIVSSDSLNVTGLNVTTNAWRVVASKTFLVFGLSGGVGSDRYSSSSSARAYVASASTSSANINLSQNLTHTNIFFDLSLNLSVAKLVGEIGRVSGGTVNTYNTFDTPAAEARPYGSVGLSFGR